jgi:hypothetical protein
MVLAARHGPPLPTCTARLTTKPVIRGGHVEICRMLLEIPVKCLRKHGVALVESLHGMISQDQQECSNLLEEGYLKDELFAALEAPPPRGSGSGGGDVAKAKKILDEAAKSPTGLRLLNRPQASNFTPFLVQLIMQEPNPNLAAGVS